jgi:hypothetical protein
MEIKMAPCDALVFSAITPERLAKLSAEVKRQSGIAINGNSGSASQLGVTVTWNHDSNTRELTIQCTSAGFLGCKSVNTRIKNAVEATAG